MRSSPRKTDIPTRRSRWAALREGKHGLAVDMDEALSLVPANRQPVATRRARPPWPGCMRRETGPTEIRSRRVKYYRKAAAQKNGYAQFCLANAYERGMGGLKKSDAQAACVLYRLAAAQGYSGG